MSKLQETVVLDLRTSNILISVLYLPISSVATEDLSKTIISKPVKENTERYTENALHRRKIEMVNAPRCSSSRTRCIQIAHTAFRTCFGNFCGRKREIYDRQRRQNTTSGKNKQERQVYRQAFLFRKVIASQRPAPIEMLVLLGNPSCRLLLLPLLRRTHELLANSGFL